MERDFVKSFITILRTNFNSHAHVERDSGASDLRSKLSISTHTLTWSVTVYINQEDETEQISTHTLTWSVTYYVICYNVYRQISTHTLTWSVTVDPTVEDNPDSISTHTLTWSVTQAYKRLSPNEVFQLTRSRGA